MGDFSMSKIITLIIALLMLITLCIVGASDNSTSLTFSPSGNNNGLIVSPYDEIDFLSIGLYRAALHTHTTESDGRKLPSESISAHQNATYDILAISDHWICTQYSGETNMLLINASELSHYAHHSISLFTDFAALNENNYGLEESMQEVASHGGIQFLAHPLNYIEGPDYHLYGVDWYLKYFDNYPHLLGMEVAAFSGYEPSVASLWDVLLVHYGQSRPVYAFGASDYHGFFINTSTTQILADTLNSSNVKQAMINGQFFYTSKGVGGVPRINDINIDNETVTVSSDATDFRWINNGAVLGTGESYTFSGLEISNYIRLEIWNGSSMIGTQAFFLTGSELILDHEMPTSKAGKNSTLRVGDTFTFDGSLSHDNVGIMNYTWTFYDHGDIVLYGMKPTYQFHNPGTYELTLTVTDVSNNTHAEVIVVQVGDNIPTWAWFLMILSMTLSLAYIVRIKNT